MLFANVKGNHLIALAYSNEGGGYRDRDLSVIAPHLIKDMSWAEMDYQEAPDSTWWGVRSDGRLIGLTYLPDEQIFAWHQHEIAGGGSDTHGCVESIAVIPEGGVDVVYLVVRRTVNGATQRYVEFLKPRQFATLADAFFVDSGLAYEGAAVSSVSGLDHLEGETVVALADGVPITGLTVISGTVTLPQTAEKIVIGLPYTAQAQLVPLAYETQAFGAASRVNLSQATFRLKDTGPGLEAGPDFVTMRTAEDDFDTGFNQVPALVNDGIREIPVDEYWTDDVTLCIQQSNPVPVTVAAVALDFAGGD